MSDTPVVPEPIKHDANGNPVVPGSRPVPASAGPRSWIDDKRRAELEEALRADKKLSAGCCDGFNPYEYA